MPNQLYWQFFFTWLKKYVMLYAMLKILPQMKKFKEKQKKQENLNPCTKAFTKIWDLSYIHIIEKKYFEDVAIPLTDVAQYWQFYKPWPTQNDSPDA